MYLTPPLKGFPLEFGNGARVEKVEWRGYQIVEKVLRQVKPSDTIPACGIQPAGQTSFDINDSAYAWSCTSKNEYLAEVKWDIYFKLTFVGCKCMNLEWSHIQDDAALFIVARFEIALVISYYLAVHSNYGPILYHMW